MKFRIAQDKWFSHEYTFAKSGILSYDKFQHFIGGIVFTPLFGIMLNSLIYGAICSAIFWFLWDVKDGLIKWEDSYCTEWPIHYNWGGDGFSWKDVVSAWMGAFLLLLIQIC